MVSIFINRGVDYPADPLFDFFVFCATGHVTVRFWTTTVPSCFATGDRIVSVRAGLGVFFATFSIFVRYPAAAALKGHETGEAKDHIKDDCRHGHKRRTGLEP